ncbi:MAG: hypothetical protein JWN34_5124 [Bryobacterales bacterium]|nr:hypothetical protein [Bryobacterales bacterium]
MKLFRRIVLRPLRADPARTLLSILSVALGVAVVLAIDLAGDAAVGSFQSSLATLTGKVDLQITANGGVDEAFLARLSALPIRARLAPVIEQTVRVSGGSAMLLGIDMIASAPTQEGSGEFSATELETAAIVSSDTADRFGWSAGQTIHLRGPNRTSEFKIRTVVPRQTSGWIALDIAAAQQLFDSFGRVDRVEISFDPNQDQAAARAAIAAQLPSSYDVQTPGDQEEEKRKMLGAFRWNLRILSYIALLVGAFFIYNTVAVGVVRRRTEIGILRAIGASALRIQGVFLTEAAVLGIVGSLIGIGIGRFLAGAIQGMLSDTVNALFVTSAPSPIAISPLVIAGAILAGTAVAVVSALIPAREAARVAPAEAMRQASLEHEARVHSTRDLVIAGILALLAVAACFAPPVDGRPMFGYAAALLAVGAMALACPGFITWALRRLRPALKGLAGASGLIAERSLATALARTSVVIAALATAIAMMVSVATMVGSFRETVQVWLTSQLSADIYMRGAGPATAGIFPAMDSRIPAILEAIPGVQDVDIFHAFPFRYQGTQATLGAGVMEIVRRKRTLRFLSGNPDTILGALPGQNNAIVSEPFATKHNVHTGDALTVALGEKTVRLTVTGIYFDYSNDRGLVIVDRGTLLHYLPNQPITNAAIYLAPGADATRVRHAIEAAVADYPVLVAPNQVLREGAIRIFDRTFAVTWALEGIAIVVAMLGAANSLLALVLDRRREIGLIRYLGASREQVRSMILTEAGLLGLLATCLGFVLGMALSLVLIFVINKQSFGWTIQFHPPVALLAEALALVWFMTVLAGAYPARFAARMQPSEAVRGE